VRGAAESGPKCPRQLVRASPRLRGAAAEVIASTFMPLTLRPTRLDSPPVYAHFEDYEVFEDGRPIGRIMELRDPTPQGDAWQWSLTIIDSGMAGIKTSGGGDSLEEVKAAFQAALEAYKAWRRAVPPERRVRRWDSDSGEG
jgi:hypothetical protein